MIVKRKSKLEAGNLSKAMAVYNNGEKNTVSSVKPGFEFMPY